MNGRFVRARCALIALCAVLGATACAPVIRRDVPPPVREQLGDFSLEGRFSLRQDEKNYSGRLSWRHIAGTNTLLLASPFGQGVAQIVTQPGEARLTASDGRVFAAPDAESLTQRVLGYSLPLGDLVNWVRGRVLTSADEQDAAGRPKRIRRDGWSIEYGYDTDDPQALPSSLFAERPGGPDLRLRVDEWTALPVGE